MRALKGPFMVEKVEWEDWYRELFSRVPLYVLMRGTQLNPMTQTLEMVDPVFVTIGDDVCLPVFHGKTAATKFLKDNKLGSAKLMAFDNLGQFLKYLKGLDTNVFSDVVFDPNTAGTKTIYFPVVRACTESRDESPYQPNRRCAGLSGPTRS